VNFVFQFARRTAPITVNDVAIITFFIGRLDPIAAQTLTNGVHDTAHEYVAAFIFAGVN